MAMVINWKHNALLSLAIISNLVSINSDMQYYLSDFKNKYKSWFDNMNLAATQNAINLLMTAALVSEDLLFKKFEKGFKNLCFQIRIFFYGAWFSAQLAIEYSNHLMCLLVSVWNFNPEDEAIIQRLTCLSESFGTIIGYPWVVTSERETIIWDHLKHEPESRHWELEFILSRLKSANPSQRKAVAPIFKAISEYQTIPWPSDI